MRKLAIFGASALVLSLGVVGASAEPFNPVSGYQGSANGDYHGTTFREGRAAATENAASNSSALEQFHEGK